MTESAHRIYTWQDDRGAPMSLAVTAGTAPERVEELKREVLAKAKEFGWLD